MTTTRARGSGSGVLRSIARERSLVSRCAMKVAVLRHAATLAFCLTLAACGASQSNMPQATLRAYADALSEGRSDDAYNMLSADTKRAITREAFRDVVKRNRDEALAIGKT